MYDLWRPVDLAKTPNHYHQILGGDTVSKIFDVALAGAPNLRKAADSTSVGPLIRQDLEAKIYELFVKKFPFFDMIEKVPANGLVHAFNQQTAYGSAAYMSELGTVTDDANTYVRATQNIAILATRRGISLKAQYAVAAGGMNYDPEAREIAGGLTAIRHQAQVGMFRLQNVDNTSVTATAENGLYDANAFNGLRYTVDNLSPAGNTTTAVPGANTPITIGVRNAANAIIDAGGEPDLILASVTGKELLIQEQIPQVRFVTDNSVEIIPGLKVAKIAAGEAELPIVTVPGDSIGTHITGGHTYTDIFVVDSSTLEWAWLGGPTPTVLDIPIGVDGTLRHLYIPFMMGALVANAPLYLARCRVQTA